MRFTITTGQIAFFKKFGFIEFENLLSEEDIQKIMERIQLKLTQRMKTTWQDKPLSDTLAAGKDLWREDAYLSQIVCLRRLAQIASELSGKSLRLLFDQVLRTPENLLGVDPLFATPKRLEELGSYHGMSLGLLLKLTESPEKAAEYPPNLTEPYPLFPWLKGSGTFITGDRPFRFNPLFSEKGQCYLLIMYGALKTLYMPNPSDPSTPLLKKLGYGSGDALMEQTHPTVFQLATAAS